VTKGILFILGMLLLFTTPLVAYADDPSDGPSIPKPILKVGRGFVNTVSSPLEIPNQMYLLADHANNNSKYGIRTAAAAIEGLFMGIGFTCWRLGAGLYDIITFPIPNYENCIITPPYFTVSFEAYYGTDTPEPSGDTPPLSPVIQ
jgi:putative exosortase-associated protein (TIGR04073 family)